MFYNWNAFWHASIVGIFTFCTIHHILSRLIPRKDERQHWKNVNITTSFIHASLSTIFSLYCFWELPAMCTTDIISSFTPRAYSLVSFEVGYFIFDSFDMIYNSPGRQTYEVLIHHVAIIGCFGISLYLGQYIGYCVASLFIEINSIFLHFRQLLLFFNRTKQDLIYRVNSMLNLGTFVICRFGLVAYLSIWLMLNGKNIPFILCIIGQSGWLLMTIINFYLFYRVIKSDFSSKRRVESTKISS